MTGELADLESALVLPTGARLSYCVRSLDGELLARRGETEPFYSASLFKLPLVMAVARRIDEGSMRLDDTLEVHNTFTSPYDGSFFGIDADSLDPFLDRSVRISATLAEVMNRTITVSSNEGANMLLDVVGFGTVNDMYRACGADSSRVERHVFDNAARDAGRTNVITTTDATSVILALLDDRVLSTDMGSHVRSLMLAQEQRSMIAAALPPTVTIGNKEGETVSVLHDMAFVRSSEMTYVMAICTEGDSNPEGVERIRSVAATLHRFVESMYR